MHVCRRRVTNPLRSLLGFAFVVFLLGLVVVPCRGQSAGMTAAGIPDLASGVLSPPLNIGSLTLQVICVPETLEIGLPSALRTVFGSEARVVFGRLAPRDLVTVQHGSWTVTPLGVPERGWIEIVRESLGTIEAASGERSLVETVVNLRGLLASAVFSLQPDVRSWLEARLGPLSKRRLAYWTFAGVFLATLLASLFASGLIWRSAAALVAYPLKSFFLGLISALVSAGVIAAFVQSRIGIPFLVLPILAGLPLIMVLPVIAAGALVVLIFNPCHLGSALVGVAIMLPCLALPAFAGTPGIAAQLLIMLWAFGGVLLSRVPGTGHPYNMKEEPHVQEILDPAAGRPLADTRSVRPGSDEQLLVAVDARQPGNDSQAESQRQHGPGNPDSSR